MTRMLYVVAYTLEEAVGLAWDGHYHGKDLKEAQEALKRITAPPTDPFYASQYKIWAVEFNITGRRAG